MNCVSFLNIRKEKSELLNLCYALCDYADIIPKEVKAMHLDDYEYEEPKMNFMSKCTMVASALIVLLFVIILIVNKDRLLDEKRGKVEQSQLTLSVEEKARLDEKIRVESLLTGETIVSSDLAFWDLYAIREESTAGDSDPIIEPEVVESTVELDPSLDGLHTKVVYANGEEEWVKINTHLERNTYDLGGLVLDGEIMKYYENSSLKSFVGVSVSKADPELNFYQLSRNGIDYAILKIGQRGYQSGEIALDDKFEEYLKACIDAGMPIGISFSSHAITTEEAIEEADFIIGKLNEFHEIYEFELAYPIVINLDAVLNDTDRCAFLDKNERTLILNTLLPKITENGYPVILYANKEWLLQNMYLSHLTQYDVWLDQTGDVPDYPYQFVMWHYTTNAVVKGAEGPLNMSISFVDFSIR